MSLEKVIALAKSQVGVFENPPNSNNVIYNTEYYGHPVNGSWYPWCVTFLWWLFKESGETMAFFNGGKTASCTTLMDLYKAEGSWYFANYIPGDIAIMSFNKSKTPQHCGLIIDYADESHSAYITIEGNTTPGASGAQDNGGSVAFKIRYPSQIIGVCRPKYTEVAPTKDWEKHYARDYISSLMEKNILTGYPDGSFKPSQPVTRGEMAAALGKAVDYILALLSLKNGMETMEPKS